MADATSRLAVVVGASSGIGAATANALADAGYHLHLLARPAEDQRIAALEPHDFPAGASQGHEQGVDFRLGCAVIASAFADEMPFASRRAVLQQLFVDQLIAHHRLGSLQELQSTQGDKVGCARAGSDEPDETLWLKAL